MGYKKQWDTCKLPVTGRRKKYCAVRDKCHPLPYSCHRSSGATGVVIFIKKIFCIFFLIINLKQDGQFFLR